MDMMQEIDYLFSYAPDRNSITGSDSTCQTHITAQVSCLSLVLDRFGEEFTRAVL
jgi:hypothetical protein